MSAMNLELIENVHVLSLTNHDHENKFNQVVMEEYLDAFDTVGAYAGNTSLLIRCEHPKTFSTGIDLQWMMALTTEARTLFIKTLETVVYRLAMFGAPTIVALNGNTYAGAAILMSGADFRLMRADRGRFCYPEVDIKIPFTPLMNDVCELLPNKHALKHMMLTGRPCTGIEAEQWNVVDSIHSEDALQLKALEMAQALAQKDRATYVTIRNQTRSKIARHAAGLGIEF
jgi:enoyl-CoA hydratase/carnithine racemase